MATCPSSTPGLITSTSRPDRSVRRERLRSVGAEAPPVGASVSHVTEKGTCSDFASSGLRTSTPILFSYVPDASYVVTMTVFCLVFPPFAGNDRVFQPGSDTSPVSVTQRYSTSAGTTPTVNVAVKVGASASGGGQAPV